MFFSLVSIVEWHNELYLTLPTFFELLKNSFLLDFIFNQGVCDEMPFDLAVLVASATKQSQGSDVFFADFDVIISKHTPLPASVSLDFYPTVLDQTIHKTALYIGTEEWLSDSSSQVKEPNITGACEFEVLQSNNQVYNLKDSTPLSISVYRNGTIQLQTPSRFVNCEELFEHSFLLASIHQIFSSFTHYQEYAMILGSLAFVTFIFFLCFLRCTYPKPGKVGFVDIISMKNVESDALTKTVTCNLQGVDTENEAKQSFVQNEQTGTNNHCNLSMDTLVSQSHEGSIPDDVDTQSARDNIDPPSHTLNKDTARSDIKTIPSHVAEDGLTEIVETHSTTQNMVQAKCTPHVESYGDKAAHSEKLQTKTSKTDNKTVCDKVVAVPCTTITEHTLHQPNNAGSDGLDSGGAASRKFSNIKMENDCKEIDGVDPIVEISKETQNKHCCHNVDLDESVQSVDVVHGKTQMKITGSSNVNKQGHGDTTAERSESCRYKSVLEEKHIPDKIIQQQYDEKSNGVVAKSRLLPTLVAVAAVAGFARIQQVGIRDMLPLRNRRGDWPMYALLTVMVWQQVRGRL
jgi:hypothetical protein